jgi:hypothetical protein
MIGCNISNFKRHRVYFSYKTLSDLENTKPLTDCFIDPHAFFPYTCRAINRSRECRRINWRKNNQSLAFGFNRYAWMNNFYCMHKVKKCKFWSNCHDWRNFLKLARLNNCDLNVHHILWYYHCCMFSHISLESYGCGGKVINVGQCW